MRKFLLLLISFFVGIGLFIWVLRMIGWQEIRSAFLAFAGWQGLVVLGLTLLVMLIGNWKWKEILRGEEIKVSFRELLKSYFAGFSIMFLSPILVFGGELFRGYILKSKNLIPWQKGISSIIIDRILEWTVNLIVIFFGVLTFLFMIGFPPKNLALIFGGVFLFFLLAISLFYFKTIKKESMAKLILKSFGLENFNHADSILEVEKEIFNFFKLQRIAMWKSIALSFFRAGIMYFRTLALISFLGKEIGILPAVSVLGFSYLAAMIPIPAALGSHEAIQTFAFNSLGLGVPTAAAFTMILRGSELIMALAGLFVLFRLGIILLKNTLYKKISDVFGK